MGSAWHWAGVMTLALAVACGGERDAAPAAGEGSMASADTAAAVAPAADTATPPSDTAAPEPAPKDTATPAPKPAATPAPKPAAAPTPAPKPAEEQAADRTPDTAASRSDTQPTAANQPTPAAPQPAAQDTPTSQADNPPPLRDAYHQAPRDTVDQATYDGWKQYNLNCARCHGEDVLGSTIAPHLVMSLKPNGPIPTQEAFVQVVCAGRPEKGMPAWCALGMDPATINQIYSYVKGRSEGKIGPGRPARREG